MGNCFNSDSSGNAARNNKSLKQAENEINKRDKEKQEHERKIHYVLLLGPDKSGKKTLLNQMRKIYDGTKSEQYMEMEGSVSHFFDSIDGNDVNDDDKNCDPTDMDDDIFRLKIQTSGIKESVLTVFYDPKQLFDENRSLTILNKNNNNHNSTHKNTSYEKQYFIFIDVNISEQNSERRKWMTVMKDDSKIHAILYVVAINEYDMTCFDHENNEIKRLDQALLLFEEYAREGILSDKPIFIFFNKYDLFMNKLQSIKNSTNSNKNNDFKFYNPDFIGDSTNESQVIDHVFNSDVLCLT